MILVLRYHNLRFDIWLCLLLAFLLSNVPVKITEKIYNNKYSSYTEEHEVEENAVGGVASSSIFQAQSVEDLLSHDTFTIVSPGIKYRNEGAGFYNNSYMYAVTLPSNERVAALINMDSVVTTGESIYSGDSILPVGKIVYEDLTTSETFLNQIEHSQKLSRYDFYIDMMGNGGKLSQDDYVSMPTMIVQIVSLVLFFVLIHMLGSKIGIFPYFFPPKEKKKSEWE